MVWNHELTLECLILHLQLVLSIFICSQRKPLLSLVPTKVLVRKLFVNLPQKVTKSSLEPVTSKEVKKLSTTFMPLDTLMFTCSSLMSHLTIVLNKLRLLLHRRSHLLTFLSTMQESCLLASKHPLSNQSLKLKRPTKSMCLVSSVWPMHSLNSSRNLNMEELSIFLLDWAHWLSLLIERTPSQSSMHWATIRQSLRSTTSLSSTPRLLKSLELKLTLPTLDILPPTWTATLDPKPSKLEPNLASFWPPFLMMDPPLLTMTRMALSLGNPPWSFCSSILF